MEENFEVIGLPREGSRQAPRAAKSLTRRGTPQKKLRHSGTFLKQETRSFERVL